MVALAGVWQQALDCDCVSRHTHCAQFFRSHFFPGNFQVQLSMKGSEHEFISGFIFEQFLTVFVLFGVTIPCLDNVTDNHCHSRLRLQIFPVSRSGIILTVCFVRKRALLTFWAFLEALRAPKNPQGALFLAKQTYEK